MKSELRWVADIGCWTMDREISETCKHRTEFCDEWCFNVDLAKVYKGMSTRDKRLENYWQQLTGSMLKTELDRKRSRQTNLVRYMSRGEAISDYSDIKRIKAHALMNPDRRFWLPTRSWRDRKLWKQVTRFLTMPNIHLCMSFDPSNTLEEWKFAEGQDFPIMFFGNDDQKAFPIKAKKFKCPKGWQADKKGTCSTCKGGCTSKRQVIVHLKQHNALRSTK